MKCELLGGMFDGKVVEIPPQTKVLEMRHENVKVPPMGSPPPTVHSRYVVLSNRTQAQYEGEHVK